MRKTKLKDSDFAQMEKVYNDLEKHVDNGPSFYLSYSLRLTIMFIAIIVIAYLAFIFYNESFTSFKENVLTYKETGSIDYDVKLLENNPFENGTLNPTNNYISDLIDDISTDFIYTYALDKESNVNYSYYIKALMELKSSSNGNIVSSNEYNLVDKIEKKVNKTKEINLKQNISLDYDYYNNLAKTIENQYDKNIIGNLRVKMFIDINVTNQELTKPIMHTQEIEITIPLVTSEVTVSMVRNIDNQNTIKDTKSPRLKSRVTLYLSIGLLIIDTIFLLLALSFILRTIPKKSKYRVTLERILSRYNERIVNCKDLPHFEEYKVINCTDFNELLDAANILEKPILYQEIVKNQKCVFIILNEHNIYKYVLKECDMD